MVFNENVTNPCYMRYYVNGNIIFLDDAGNMTYDPGDREFYAHRHVEEQNLTRPATELAQQDIDVLKELAELEQQAGGDLDVVCKDGDDMIVAAGSLFRLALADLDRILEPDNLSQLQDFYLPRGLDEPYCIQFDEDVLIIY